MIERFIKGLAKLLHWNMPSDDNIITIKLEPMDTEHQSNSYILYETAKNCLEHDMVNDPKIDPMFGCAQAVSEVFYKAFNEPLGGGASTKAVYEHLRNDSRFKQVQEPTGGDIIVSPTGYSDRGAPHGHVGIMGFHGVMSNNSMNGLWEEKYTLETWKNYYETRLGFPTYYFRMLDTVDN